MKNFTFIGRKKKEEKKIKFINKLENCHNYIFFVLLKIVNYIGRGKMH